MARELIATLITNSNGEAFYTYTGTGAGETTFIAESGDLESEPLIVNDVLERITLTADKNILSYSDNDTVTLTATYEGTTLEGKSVVFKIGDTVLDTIQTDSNGVAEYTYSSQGVGDVTFTVECMNLQETYAIEDCIKYIAKPSDYQSLTFPSGNFSIEWLTNAQNLKATSAIKDNGNNYIGLASNNRDVGFYNPNNFLPTKISWDTDIIFLLTHNNGVWTFSANGESVTDNRTLTAPIIIRSGAIKCQDWKIKPL